MIKTKETCWQSILRIMADGKPHRFAQIADATGFQVNTVERYVHAINRGKYGNYQIITESEPGKPTVLARLSNTSRNNNNCADLLAICIKTIDGYPIDCKERKKIEIQILELEKKICSN